LTAPFNHLSEHQQRQQEERVAVKIRMKMMGRKHRPFFRICAIDGRNPRDGRVLEELGTYDPMVKEVDARALLKSERIDYWLGVGAQPSVNVKVLIKKYGSKGTHVNEQQAARERLSLPKIVPDAGEPAYVPKSPEESAAEAAAAAAAPAEAVAEAPAEEAAGEASEE
jgi:small subunit ribosomal protein S16